MRLKNITHNDKVWAAFRLMPKGNAILAAADIAESVLHIFEANHPNDFRPRKAIEAARSMDVYSTANAAYAAADAANDANAAAYTAVAHAAHAAYAAADAAAYAATNVTNDANAAAANAAYAAAYAANYHTVGSATLVRLRRQERLIRKIVLKYWKPQ